MHDHQSMYVQLTVVQSQKESSGTTKNEPFADGITKEAPH